MDPFAQAHLSELLASARHGPPVPSVDSVEHKSRTLMTFGAALAALKGVGAVSQEEMAEWTNRMLVALGEEPLEPLPPGTARLISFGGTRTQRPERPPDPPPVSKFLRLVPADEPDRALGRTADGSRYSEWSSTATRSPSTGGSLLSLTHKHSSPRNWLNKSPISRDSRTTSRRSFGTNSCINCRCGGNPSGLTDDVGTEFRPTGAGSGGGRR